MNAADFDKTLDAIIDLAVAKTEHPDEGAKAGTRMCGIYEICRDAKAGLRAAALPERTIVQIASVNRDSSIPELIALYNDGTLWRCQLLNGYSIRWMRIETPPQPIPDFPATPVQPK